MPSSLRIELDRLGFDWDTGRCLVQDGNARVGFKPPRKLASMKEPELDARWPNGAYSLDVPRFMGADDKAVYIPHSGPQGCGLTRIARNFAPYLTDKGTLPYPEI